MTFPNDVCTGANSGDDGTCFTNTECTAKSGSVDGNCASGFGVCCTFTYSSCGSKISQNRSYITNPGYPTAYTVTGTAASCSYSVTPLSSNICQLRLDFDAFALAITAADGACIDTFAVTVGSGRDYPSLCGTNTGEHIYLETGQVTTDQTLAFTVTPTTGSATYKIKVSQIECFSTNK